MRKLLLSLSVLAGLGGAFVAAEANAAPVAAPIISGLVNAPAVHEGTSVEPAQYYRRRYYRRRHYRRRYYRR